MAARDIQDPGGGPNHGGGLHPTYAERLKTNVNYDQRLKRNVLEVVLERIDRDAEMVLDEQCVARLLRSIGMDVETQVEGYQIHHHGRSSMISVWAMKGLNLERFCKEEGITVTKGIMTGRIRPAGRKDVTVTISGLDFNTPDTLILEYIKKFGGIIISNNVIYSKFNEGLFKGKYNGERKYQVDFSNSSRNMGTFHYIDGARIRVFYRGNEKTCGRCQKTARNCLGGGFAKVCDEAGGSRVHLNDHMKTLWGEIGFVPSGFELPEVREDSENDQPMADTANFPRKDITAPVTELDKERYVGLTIANVSLEVEDADIKKFIAEQVSSEILEENIIISREKKKSVVTINSSLSAITIKEAMDRINFRDCKEKFFGKPLYCRPLRNITPEKSSVNPSSPETINHKTPSSTGAVKKIPGLPNSAQSKALDRKEKRDKKDKKDKEKKQKAKEEEERKKCEEDQKRRNERIKKNVKAFDVLMGARKQQNLACGEDLVIPTYCSPSPWTSEFGQRLEFGQSISSESRRLSFSSPFSLDKVGKRGAEQLSSPSSPDLSNGNKKNKADIQSKQ